MLFIKLEIKQHPIIVLILMLFVYHIPAWADVVLPDSAKPGSSRQDLETKLPSLPENLLAIPPLVERPLATDEGDRITVNKFLLIDARDLPHHSILVADLEAILEDARASTSEFTIGQLEQVANQITNYYRSRGLILSKAVLPVQTVEDGQVKIQVIEGKLGQVLADGNKIYSRSTLERPFRSLLNEPVAQDDIESSLLILTDFPGLAAFGMFQPGKKIGEADLLLKVPNEERFNLTLRADNHGSETTGQYRGRAQVHWNNLTGNADRLSLVLQQSAQPANSLYLAGEYHLILSKNWQANAFLRHNTFDVDLGKEFEGLEISGSSSQYGLSGRYIWIRSREKNLSTRLDLASKQAITNRMGKKQNSDQLTVLTLGVNYDSVDTRFNGLNYLGVEVSKGFNDFLGSMGDSASAYEKRSARDAVPSRQGATLDSDKRAPYAEGEFTKLFFFYSRLQNLTNNSSLLLRSELQYSPSLLVPIEQYAAGGPDHLRGYLASYTLYDSAAFIALEYIIQAPFLGDSQAFSGWKWRDLLQFSIFYDHAIGNKNDPLPREIEGNFQLSSLGAGLRFSVPNELSLRLQLAKPLLDETGNDKTEAKPQAWFDFAWHF